MNCISISQRGQASVFILALLGVVLVCAILLYQSGRLTSEKMQLQNAADAAAYGASTLEARALNFAAYTNRAMVANEVGIGQMVGMLSWADELKSVQGYTSKYAAAFHSLAGALSWLAEFGIPELCEAIAEFFTAVGKGFDAVGKTLESGLKTIAPPYITFLTGVNWLYSNSQEVYVWGTEYLILANVYKSLENNVPGTNPGSIISEVRDLVRPESERKGGQLSRFGALAIAGHIWSTIWGNQHTTRYATRAKGDNSGMGRMAATIRESRDPFSSGGPPIKVKNIFGREVEYGNRDWTLGLDVDLRFIDFFLGAVSKGGSELRHKDNAYVWSAVDTAVLEAKLSWGVKILKKKFKGSKKIDGPFGAGSFQAGAKGDGGSGTTLNLTDMPFDLGKKGYPKAYGGAGEDAGRWVTWEDAGGKIGGNDVKSGGSEVYGGLRPYRDVTLPAAKKDGYTLPFLAPFFLIGVTRAMNDVAGQGPQFADQLDLVELDERRIADRLAAIAKSEVYFARPDTPGYFARLDKNQENPNVFSPFWQARLVETTDIDRFLAMALQSNTIWLSTNDAEKIPGLEAASRILENLLKKINP
ncbi:MAG: pilus assembly protein TadG-related protein [Desulfobulbaceae bacterium]